MYKVIIWILKPSSSRIKPLPIQLNLYCEFLPSFSLLWIFPELTDPDSSDQVTKSKVLDTI